MGSSFDDTHSLIVWKGLYVECRASFRSALVAGAATTDVFLVVLVLAIIVC